MESMAAKGKKARGLRKPKTTPLGRKKR